MSSVVEDQPGMDLRGRAAVVTGGASGIGRALARRFVRAGAVIVLADIEDEPLHRTVEELRQLGGEAVGIRTDVSDRESVQALAAMVVDRHGPPALLCNNAGVGMAGWPVWTLTERDWSWMLGVNLLGVIHGVDAFLPAMIDGGQRGHILNTSSAAGLAGGPGGIYDITKHAVTRYTEVLWHDLRAKHTNITCSLLCPGRVATRLNTAVRNRPADLVDRPLAPEEADFLAEREAMFLAAGMSPDDVADAVMAALGDGRFYVLTHDWARTAVRDRLEAIIDGRRPASKTQGAGR